MSPGYLDVGLRDDLSEQVLPVFLDLMGSWARNRICIEFTLKILHLILNQGRLLMYLFIYFLIIFSKVVLRRQSG